MIHIFNSLTRQKEEFQPLVPGKVMLYSCGPTVYGKFHVGNGRSFVVVDVIRRWLMHRGFEVTFVQNITDVDDKIINKANEEGVETKVITDTYTKYFLDRLALLGNLPASDHPRATQHIAGMVSLIRKLEEKGVAYPTPDGSVWFEVAKFPEYGKLSRMPLDQMKQGERVSEEILSKKRSPLDFGLWKAAKPGEPSWPSPWGEGRPGWHIECSCMAMDVFKSPTIDIHAGGSDLRFPHHENEIAQSEAATGQTFARYWVHNGMLAINGDKMGKSLGNITSLEDALAVADVLTLRYFLLSGKYRDELDFTPSALHSCQSAAERMANAQREAERVLGRPAVPAEPKGDVQGHELYAQFCDGMDDDFNTPQALAALAQLTTALNATRTEAEAGDTEARARLPILADTMALMRGALGLTPQLEKKAHDFPDELMAPLRALAAKALSEEANGADGPTLIDKLIVARQAARKAKNFGLGDEIRNGLTALGVVLEDKPTGTTWKRG